MPVSEWGTSGHLEPPAAPSHTTNTEQQYTDQMTTTAQPQWPPHQDSTGQHYFTGLERYHALGVALHHLLVVGTLACSLC